jgi:hypothetical protein
MIAPALLPAITNPRRMERLDRLRWSGGLAFTSYGVNIGIRVNDPAALERLPRHLPPQSEPSASPIVDHLYSLHIGAGGTRAGERRSHRLYINARRLLRTPDVDDAFAFLESGLEIVVSREARDVLFVHAGVVGWRGRALVIPGRSLSGKSSLVSALVRAGATYYSDEFAVIDSEGHVHPYPRRLAIRQEGLPRPRRMHAGELGGRVGSEPLPVGLVVLARYRPGAQWNPRPLSPGRALLGLLDHTVVAQVRPQFALARLRTVVCEARVVQGTRGEAPQVARALLNQDWSSYLTTEQAHESHSTTARTDH